MSHSIGSASEWSCHRSTWSTPEAIKRTVKLLARALLVPPVRLGGDEEAVGLALEPGRDPQLGLAVRGGGIDVVDPVLQEDLERAVRNVLGHAAERGGAKDDARAPVTGVPERRCGNHLAQPTSVDS